MLAEATIIEVSVILTGTNRYIVLITILLYRDVFQITGDSAPDCQRDWKHARIHVAFVVMAALRVGGV